MLDDLYDAIGKESLSEITCLEKLDLGNSSPAKMGVSTISETPMECAKSTFTLCFYKFVIPLWF